MKEKFLVACLPLFLWTSVCRAEVAAAPVPTIAEISKAVFSKCKAYDENCVNEALAAFGCSLNNPLSQDPTSEDGIVNSAKQQCVKGLASSGVRILGEFEGEESFPQGSYGLRFEMGEGTTNEAIGFRKTKRRFAGLGEFLTDSGLIVNQIGSELIVVPESVWKKNEFTFMGEFTLDKTSKADIERARKREGFGVLPGGKARIEGLDFDNEGRLIKLSVSDRDQVLNRILMDKITKEFGKPSVSYIMNETGDAKKQEELRALVDVSIKELRMKGQLLKEEAQLLTTAQKVLAQCREMSIKLGTYTWNPPLVNIKANFVAIGCSDNPEENLLSFGGMKGPAITFTSQKYLDELRAQDEVRKQGERLERKQLRNDANSLF